LTFFCLFFLLSVSASLAELVKPGTAISPRTNQNNTIPPNIKMPNAAEAPVLEPLPSNPNVKVPKAPNNSATTNPKSVPNSLTAPKAQINNKDQMMMLAYAKQAYIARCNDDYRMTLRGAGLKRTEEGKYWQKIQSPCDCLATEVLSQVQAADLIDFMMFQYGEQNFEVKDKAREAFSVSHVNQQIFQLGQNPQIRKKCGFIQ
jgi:hypothetical protein